MRTIFHALAVAAFVAASPVLAEETLPSVAPAVEPGPGGEAEAEAPLTREERIAELLETLKTATDPRAAKRAENDVLRLWLESGSDTVDLLMRWSLKALEAKEYARALDYLDRITILAPDYAEGWNKRATVHFLRDDYSRSIADLGRTLELEPRHFGALSGLGAILRSIGDEKRAIEAYRAALAIDPHLEEVKKALEELEKKDVGEPT